MFGAPSMVSFQFCP